MEDIVKDMILSKFLSCNSPQSYHHYIQVAKLLLKRPNIVDIIKDVDGKETGSKTLCMSGLHGETFVIASKEEKTASYQCHHPVSPKPDAAQSDFTLHLSERRKEIFCAIHMTCTWNKIQLAALPHLSTQPLPQTRLLARV